ncbi:hypothetical protein [Nocardia sp. CY41]|uniref:hypothetical protein n=1 Tax=Nocardia sp. CY41 TaxID=2608686 RepID=UPI00135A5D96|nr:hypothetical protein [Nocardia sp. CY41]
MQNITIGRYKPGQCTATRIHHDDDGNEVSREEFDPHAGWIEGIRDDGTSWIMFMDANGSPQCFWPQREPDGAVVGDAIELT